MFQQKHNLITRDADLKLGLYLIAGFILFTAIGTLSHELGHFTAARLLGYNASINYGYTFFGDPLSSRDAFVITLGGPLQTMVTGTLGIFLVIHHQKSFYSANKLNSRQWLLVFISLFWLRELFNFLLGMGVYFSKGHFPEHNDEVKLASRLDLNPLSFSLPAAIIAAFVLCYLVFKFIPVKQRLTFLLSGLIGGPLGFYLWLYLVGPVLMP